jgi:NADH:ubiquinone oxidoreductase subunit 2 (subunit N)
VGIVISIYYYFGWIRAMLTDQESEEQAIAISFEDRIIYGFIIALIVLLGLIPGILISIIQ